MFKIYGLTAMWVLSSVSVPVLADQKDPKVTFAKHPEWAKRRQEQLDREAAARARRDARRAGKPSGKRGAFNMDTMSFQHTGSATTANVNIDNDQNCLLEKEGTGFKATSPLQAPKKRGEARNLCEDLNYNDKDVPKLKTIAIGSEQLEFTTYQKCNRDWSSVTTWFRLLKMPKDEMWAKWAPSSKLVSGYYAKLRKGQMLSASELNNLVHERNYQDLLGEYDSSYNEMATLEVYIAHLLGVDHHGTEESGTFSVDILKKTPIGDRDSITRASTDQLLSQYAQAQKVKADMASRRAVAEKNLYALNMARDPEGYTAKLATRSELNKIRDLPVSDQEKNEKRLEVWRKVTRDKKEAAARVVQAQQARTSEWMVEVQKTFDEKGQTADLQTRYRDANDLYEKYLVVYDQITAFQDAQTEKGMTYFDRQSLYRDYYSANPDHALLDHSILEDAYAVGIIPYDAKFDYELKSLSRSLNRRQFTGTRAPAVVDTSIEIESPSGVIIRKSE